MDEYGERFNTTINALSFVLGLLNLRENLTQNDKQDIVDSLNKKADVLLTNIDNHLKNQDKKIDRILRILEDRGEH